MNPKLKVTWTLSEGASIMKLWDLDLRNFPVEKLSKEETDRIREIARQCRAWAVTMTSVANSGHPAGSLSSMEMYLLAYAGADITPENFRTLDRDYVVISHGHTSPGAYAALAAHGFFEPEQVMAHFRQAGSPFQGHVERQVPGIDWGSGNLGQGLSAGVGYAMACRARGSNRRVFVLMSDGEQVKGQIAEARRMAVKENLSNLTVLIDFNHIQISGRIEEIMPADLPALWKADGWTVLECKGQDPADLYDKMVLAAKNPTPAVIFCHNVMGSGVSFMEDVPDYHGKAATGEHYEKAMKELGFGPSMGEEARKRRTQELPVALEDPFNGTVDIETGTPREYGADKKTDNRSAFGSALEDVGKTNYERPGATPVLVFDCDLAGSVKTDGFAKSCPGWFKEMGIQEHSTATVAGAASCAGVVSLWADFGVFGLDEVYNQQRLNDINGTNLKVALTHVGLDVGEDGMTHQCIDYAGLLRNTYGWKLVVPADPNQTDRVTRWALGTHGNICLAMGRSKLPVIPDEAGEPLFGKDYEFRYGKADLVREGNDGTIFCMGHMAHRALKAWEALVQQGVRPRLLHVACPLEVDEEALEKAVQTGVILTYEDHHWRTGLGGALALSLAERGASVKFRALGVTRYGDSGTSEEVFSRMGLSPEVLAKSFLDLVSK
jgi:transketolase